ncbi:MAG: transcription initiation factor IIB [Nitrososphaerales archaeon]
MVNKGNGNTLSLQALEKCPRCGKASMVLDANTGEQICTNCGYVFKEKIEATGPEWRTFAKDEGGVDRARTGMPSSLAMHDMGLSTVIGKENRDASGRALQSSMKTTLERLRTWDKRSQVHESVDRNLRQAFSELARLTDKLKVSDSIVERAAYIYRKAVERRLIRGRSISAMIAASLYAAMRDSETPRNLKDLAAVSNVKRKELSRSYRLLLKELELKMPVADPIKVVSRIASKAGVQEKTKRRAIEILRRASETGSTAGKDPMGLAASALYIASVMENENKTQKDMAEAAGVTEVTIRNRYKTLKEALQM